MPSSPQDGRKRPYDAKRGLSRSRGRMGTVTSKAFLPLVDTSAFVIQFQPVKLLLVERIHCLFHWQNRIEVIARPLHSALIEVLAVLHRDEFRVQEDADTFHCGVLGYACLGGDGVVAGMAGVCPAILNQQQIGVDYEHRGRKVQQKNLVGQSEKLSAISTLEGGSVLIGDEPFTNQSDQILFHRYHCHVDALRDYLWR